MHMNFLFIVEGYTCMIYTVKIKWFGCSHPLNRCKKINKKNLITGCGFGRTAGIASSGAVVFTRHEK